MGKPNSSTTNSRFECACGGPISRPWPSLALHQCANKYAPGTSYYDGVGRWVEYKRVLISPALTGGAVKFNWFVSWS